MYVRSGTCFVLLLMARRSTSLEINHKVKEVIKKSEAGAGVAVKIEHAAYESAKQYGRHCALPFSTFVRDLC